MKWYRKAAEQGNAEAQSRLGYMYGEGEGVAKDDAEAVKWNRKAAEQGDYSSQDAVGNSYFDGKGVPQDYVEAAKWYRLSAEQGYTGSMSQLGMLYSEGKGVPQDFVQAYLWFGLTAVGKGSGYFYEVAISRRDEVASKMTPPQIIEAKRLTEKWLATHAKPCGISDCP